MASDYIEFSAKPPDEIHSAGQPVRRTGVVVGGRAVSRQVGKAVFLCVVGFVTGASGCATSSHTTIAKLHPYTGQRPSKIGPLPSRPAPRAGGSIRGDAGWQPSRGLSKRWKCVVIHHSANRTDTPAGMRAFHMNKRGWDELGYHFVIGNGVNYGDGKVYVGQRWKQQMHGAHTKVPGNYYNNHGIGICLIGNFERERPTARQLDSLAKLLSFLSQRCGIPRSKLLTHGGVTGKTACPGRHFSMQAVLRKMNSSRYAWARR